MIGRGNQHGVDIGTGESVFVGHAFKRSGTFFHQNSFRDLAMFVVDIADATQLSAAGIEECLHHLTATPAAADQRHTNAVVCAHNTAGGGGAYNRASQESSELSTIHLSSPAPPCPVYCHSSDAGTQWERRGAGGIGSRPRGTLQSRSGNRGTLLDVKSAPLFGDQAAAQVARESASALTNPASSVYRYLRESNHSVVRSETRVN